MSYSGGIGVSADLVLAAEPTSLVAVHDQCSKVEAWAERCDSPAQVRDAINRLAAIDEYLKRTSIEGRERVAATMRRLEVRVGKLLGPAENGGDRRSDQFTREGTGLSANERHAFRRIAEHEDVVEKVIAESTTAQPASRRKVLQAIDAHEWDQVEQHMDRQGIDDTDLKRATLRANTSKAVHVVTRQLLTLDPERVALVYDDETRWDDLVHLGEEIADWFTRLRAARPNRLRAVK